MNTPSSTASRHWKPNVTVAAIIEQEGKFLLVEEITDRGNRFNQPAGHLEEGETIIDAAIRETLEETAYDFTPQALVGIYHWQHPVNGVTYLRFAFTGVLGTHHAERALDEGIIRTVWKSEAEIAAEDELMRSPQVLLCVQDYLAGKRYSLDLLKHLGQAL